MKNQLVKGLKRIGKGTFTTCYMAKDGLNVILESCDPVKECMSFGWFPDSHLFPKVHLVDTNVYAMAYLGGSSRSLEKDLDKDQYKIYQNLRDCYKMYWLRHTSANYNHWYQFFEQHVKNPDVKNALLEALDALANFGQDISFEISPRNVRAVDGKLVLMDCFFFASALEQSRSR